jgi:hypothetical protein
MSDTCQQLIPNGSHPKSMALVISTERRILLLCAFVLILLFLSKISDPKQRRQNIPKSPATPAPHAESYRFFTALDVV